MARIVIMSIAVVVALALAVQTASAQAPAAAPVPPTPSTGLPANQPCVAQLMPCADFYQDASVKPPESCCAPLREAYATELTCLCTVLTNPALGAAIGVDLKKGVSLFGRCGVKVPADVCSIHAPAPGPGSSSPTSSPKTSNSGATRVAKWVGYTGFLLALLSLLA